MPLRLFNTLTGKKETFKPLEKGVVKMYNCGPTVYNYAHIGNLRAYVFADVLRRALEYNGYKVRQVMNITDVGHLTSDADDGDDKMLKALKREGKPFTLEAMREVADFYAKAFVEDLKALNCELPHAMPRASDNIPEDIEIIKKLEAKGFAYKTGDGVYFDTGKFPSYGKLGNINLKGQLAGARAAINSEKKNPADFTLWKISRNDIGWQSPWGKGFPGWHIECSAMSRKYLGQPFDVHTGGIDHIPIHHNNEIAQSEAAFGVPLANYWLHNEHLIVPTGPASAGSSGEVKKMAKSGENFITLKTLKEKGIHPLSYRYFLLQTHYRSPLNFSWEALEGAQTGFENLLFSIWSFSQKDLIEPNVEYSDSASMYSDYILKSTQDDFNTASAISFLNGIVHHSTSDPKEKLDILFKHFDPILGLSLKELSKKIGEIPERIKILIEKHDKARELGDWKESGEIRDTIISKGYRVQNFSVSKKSLVTRTMSSLI